MKHRARWRYSCTSDCDILRFWLVDPLHYLESESMEHESQPLHTNSLSINGERAGHFARTVSHQWDQKLTVKRELETPEDGGVGWVGDGQVSTGAMCPTPSSDPGEPLNLCLSDNPVPAEREQSYLTVKLEPDSDCESQADRSLSHPNRLAVKLSNFKTEPDVDNSSEPFSEKTWQGSVGHPSGKESGAETGQQNMEESDSDSSQMTDTDEEEGGVKCLPVYFPSHSRNTAEGTALVQASNCSDHVKYYQCGVCFESHDHPTLLKDHMYRHRMSGLKRPVRCGLCYKPFRYCSDLTQHIVVHTGERHHQCKVCQSTFTKASSLKQHMKIHTGEKPYPCDQCSSRFRLSSHLKEHKRTHTGERPFQCEVCKVRFTSASSLRLHRKIHTGERRFKCDQCSVMFNQALHLEIHMRIHTGEKPFRCETCSLSYRYKSSLKSHMFKVHFLEKPYKCQSCDAAFTSSELLAKHEKKLHDSSKKTFTCEECSATFMSPGGLTQHKWIHTGEKPFKCEFCPAAFRDATTLKRHKVIHAGDKAFKCNQCCASFKLSTHLSRHMKIHDNRQPSDSCNDESISW